MRRRRPASAGTVDVVNVEQAYHERDYLRTRYETTKRFGPFHRIDELKFDLRFAEARVSLIEMHRRLNSN